MTGPSSFNGLPVFPGAHNFRDELGASFDHFGAWVGSPAGKISWDDWAGGPVGGRRLTWTTTTRGEALAMRTWLLALRGMQGAFYVPTFTRDLRLVRDWSDGWSPPPTDYLVMPTSDPDWVAPSHIVAVSNEAHYRDRMFGARQHLAAFVRGASSWVIRTVASVADNGDGTDALTLDDYLTGTAVHVPPATPICYVLLCRLASDELRFTWRTPTVAEITLDLVELPAETV